MRHLFHSFLALFLVGFTLALCGQTALAAASTNDVCKEVAAKAKLVLWDEFRKAADESFCRKPWVERDAREFLACAGANKAIKISSRLRDRWNRFFDKADAEWATLGPRSIDSDWEKGTIKGGFKRTFFGAALAMNRSIVDVKKRGGRAKATITVCELDQNGGIAKTHRKNFESGKNVPRDPKTIELESDEETRIVGIVVDTPAGLNNFEYSARLRRIPERTSGKPISGIADLHVHQFANLAFAGRFYWGEHDGPAKTALAPEVVTTEPPEREGALRLTLDGMDANILLKSQKKKPDDEGFFTLGSDGHPDYKAWPHHADRSHQQAHIDWLREATTRGRRHGRNLSLVVVSLVNNDILCKLFKAIDPKGNVPKRNASGGITGWKSAPWGCEDDENVKRQLEAAHALERRYPWYRIAMSPWHARKIIDDGDLAVVLSIETDKPLSESSGRYGNWENKLDFYRTQGVTTLQVVHESDSLFCGAAQHRNVMRWLQLIHWPKRSLRNLIASGTTFDLNDKGRNRVGLTDEGRELIETLVARNMPIDIAHGSVKCRRQIMKTVPSGYGLYDSHTKFERLLKPGQAKNYGTRVLDREKTFLITEDIEQDYIDNRVLIGLRTASVDVYDAPSLAQLPRLNQTQVRPNANVTKAKKRRVANNCPGSATSFAQLVHYAHERGFTFAYGSDFNTGVAQLGPRFGEERCFAAREILTQESRTKRPVGPEPNLPERADQINPIAGTNYYTDGLATIGWLPELTLDLIELGTPGAESLADGAEHFLQMWERAYP